MPKTYEGIEKDAFSLASAYYGIMEMVMKDATLEEIVHFLADRTTTDLPDVACRVLNGGIDNAAATMPIDAKFGLRLVSLDGKGLE